MKGELESHVRQMEAQSQLTGYERILHQGVQHQVGAVSRVSTARYLDGY